MKKTNIQLLVGLRYPRFIEYLDWLVQRGLVERISDVEEGAELYQLSARGLDAYRRLIEWMNEVIQDMTLEKLVE